MNAKASSVVPANEKQDDDEAGAPEGLNSRWRELVRSARQHLATADNREDERQTRQQRERQGQWMRRCRE